MQIAMVNPYWSDSYGNTVYSVYRIYLYMCSDRKTKTIQKGFETSFYLYSVRNGKIILRLSLKMKISKMGRLQTQIYKYYVQSSEDRTRKVYCHRHVKLYSVINFSFGDDYGVCCINSLCC